MILKAIGYISLLTFLSCKGQKNMPKLFVKPDVATKDNKSFFDNYYPILNLNERFIALNEASNNMSKTAFFDSLLTAKFLPLKLILKDTIYYKLHKFNANTDKSITATIQTAAYYAYENFKLEGKKIPSFSFKDMNDNIYDTISTKGKIVVIKCWFIKCTPCVAEFPFTNSLVTKYQNKDVVFLGLAFDTKEALEQFLPKNKFLYSVIPNQRDYVVNSLKIKSFPTHIIIGKDGFVVKSSGSYKEIEKELEDLTSLPSLVAHPRR